MNYSPGSVQRATWSKVEINVWCIDSELDKLALDWGSTAGLPVEFRWTGMSLSLKFFFFFKSLVGIKTPYKYN